VASIADIWFPAFRRTRERLSGLGWASKEYREVGLPGVPSTTFRRHRAVAAARKRYSLMRGCDALTLLENVWDGENMVRVEPWRFPGGGQRGTHHEIIFEPKPGEWLIKGKADQAEVERFRAETRAWRAKYLMSQSPSIGTEKKETA
jgi:hypothetical protein